MAGSNGNGFLVVSYAQSPALEDASIPFIHTFVQIRNNKPVRVGSIAEQGPRSNLIPNNQFDIGQLTGGLEFSTLEVTINGQYRQVRLNRLSGESGSRTPQATTEDVMRIQEQQKANDQALEQIKPQEKLAHINDQRARLSLKQSEQS